METMLDKNIHNKMLLVMILLIGSLTSGCGHKGSIKKKIDLKHIKEQKALATHIDAESQAPRITIWIHGTKSLGPVSNYFHGCPQAGLMHISNVPNVYRIAGVIKALAKADPFRFPLEHCHLFGWSGDLNFEGRKKEAKKLYDALKLLSANYKDKYGIVPAITLITHSHGGNVALNLVNVKDATNTLIIDKAILLACPVQHETKELVKDPMFKQLFSFYSTSDLLQVIDPQGLYCTEHNPKKHLEFSDRQFPISKNVYQAKLRINGHGVAHVGFILQSFSKLLPSLIDAAEKWEHEAPSIEGQERVLSIMT